MIWRLAHHDRVLARGSWKSCLDEAVKRDLAGVHYVGRRSDPVPVWRVAPGVSLAPVATARAMRRAA